MGYDAQIKNPQFLGVYYEEAPTAQYSAMIMGASDLYAKKPTAAGQVPFGIAKDSYDADTTRKQDLIVGGVGVPYIAYSAHSAGDFLSIADPTSNAGRLDKAPHGAPFCGRALIDVDAAGDTGLMHMMFGYMQNESIVIETTVTADTTISDGLPTGYKVTNLISKNGTTNSVDLKVGTSAGGEQIVAAATVGSTAQVDHTIVVNHTSLTADQDIILSSASWNNASLTVYIAMEKVI